MPCSTVLSPDSFCAWRCGITGVPRRAWYSAAALAGTLTVMNLCFYNALTRIPLGIAVTIEVLGPLILSVVVSTRRIAWLWALLALSGVALLGIAHNHGGHADPVGFAFAAGAAAAGQLHPGLLTRGGRLPSFTRWRWQR